MKETRVEWEPIRDGFQVKLRGFGGNYLRANGGTPPWRNTVTHDSPYSGSTQNWILWNVEPVDVPENESLTDYLTMVSSFSSVSDELSSLDLGSPMSIHSSFSFSPRMAKVCFLIMSTYDFSSLVCFFITYSLIMIRIGHILHIS